MPFLIASLAIVYYLPYIAFTSANQDLINLRRELKKENIEPERIAKHYFNNRIVSPRQMTLRVLVNILVKVMYAFCTEYTILLDLDLDRFSKSFKTGLWWHHSK